MRQCIFLQSIPYLFHKDALDEARILAEILEMQQHYFKFEVIPDLELDGFINDARDLFDKQMKNLQKKTAQLKHSRLRNTQYINKPHSNERGFYYGRLLEEYLKF